MKQRLQIFLVIFTLLFTGILVSLSHFSPERFETFCDQFFQEEMEANTLTQHYTVANPQAYGIHCEKISLGSYDLNISAQKKYLYTKWLTLKSIARGTLSKEQQLTYDLLCCTI